MRGTLTRRRSLALICAAIAVAAIAFGAIRAPHGEAGTTGKAAPSRTLALGCGTLITTSTTLANDVLNCNANGLIVTGSNVTLNLNGHTVGGLGSAAGITLNGSGDTVTNGTVQNFLLDVTVNGLKGRVQSIHATGGLSGISVAAGGALVTGNVAAGNSIGIAINDGANTHVTNNWARSNTADGMQIFAGGTTVTGNKALNNGHTGINASTSPGSVITGNVANGNGISGITSADGATVGGNTASFNTAYGVSTTLFGNDAGGNKGTGNGNTHACLNVVCS